MKKMMLAAFFMAAAATIGFSQSRFFTKQGTIHFFSATKMENIDAKNTTANAVLDTETGKFEWGVTIKGFKFEKALMEEHFNENYLESTKYPKASFKGKIDDLSKVNFSKDGTYNVRVSGDLTIHGKAKSVSTDGTIIVKGGSIQTKSKFTVKCSDHDISIPAVVKDNISNEIAVDVDATLAPMTK